MLPLFTFLHPLVDALTVSIVLCTASGWTAFLVCNFCAFALQLPFGIALDRFPGLTRPAFGAGIALLAVGATLRLVTDGEWVPVSVAGVGNALFHLSAGKLILDRTDGKAGPIGLFISTGAVGLLAGRLLTDPFPQLLPAALALLLLPLGAIALVRVSFAAARRCVVRTNGWPDRGVVLLLFCLVVWRGHVALSSSGSDDAGVFLLAAGAAVTLMGKIAGGYAADATNGLAVVSFGVAGSALLWFGVGYDHAVFWLGAIFLAQLATGPVLSLLYRRLGRASGTGFGLNCLGLFAGFF